MQMMNDKVKYNNRIYCELDETHYYYSHTHSLSGISIIVLPPERDIMFSLLTLFFLVIFSLGCSSFSINGRGRFNISSDDVKTNIENGVKVDISQVPWQVALRPQGYYGSFCGGSIIDKHWVLTAAHCIIQKD